MGTITTLPETTKNPITLMGQRAAVCWGGNVEDPEKNYKRGMDCIISGHGRVMEYVNVEMIIAGYSASRASGIHILAAHRHVYSQVHAISIMPDADLITSSRRRSRTTKKHWKNIRY